MCFDTVVQVLVLTSQNSLRDLLFGSDFSLTCKLKRDFHTAFFLQCPEDTYVHNGISCKENQVSMVHNLGNPTSGNFGDKAWLFSLV